MENQIKIRVSKESILEEEEIISLVLKRQVLRQMLSFLTLAKSWCWAARRAVTLGGSHSPGKFCDCSRAQKDAAVSLPPPASWLPFTQVPCWPPSCWWPAPSRFAVRLDQLWACSRICSRHKRYLPSPGNPPGAGAERWNALPYLLLSVVFGELD